MQLAISTDSFWLLMSLDIFYWAWIVLALEKMDIPPNSRAAHTL